MATGQVIVESYCPVLHVAGHYVPATGQVIVESYCPVLHVAGHYVPATGQVIVELLCPVTGHYVPVTGQVIVESYCPVLYVAGHYVPATGQVIVESNSVYAKNLKGIGIGNGWVDPKLQYGAYSEVCYINSPFHTLSSVQYLQVGPASFLRVLIICQLLRRFLRQNSIERSTGY